MRKKNKPLKFYILLTCIAVAVWLGIMLVSSAKNSANTDNEGGSTVSPVPEASIASGSSVTDSSEINETNEVSETSQMSETNEIRETSQTSETSDTSKIEDAITSYLEEIEGYGRYGERYTELTFSIYDSVQIEIANQQDFEALIDTGYYNARLYIISYANTNNLKDDTVTLMGARYADDGATHLFIYFENNDLVAVLINYPSSTTHSRYLDIIPLDLTVDDIASVSTMVYDEELGGLIYE